MNIRLQESLQSAENSHGASNCSKSSDPSKPFMSQTDTLEVGLGAVLSQKDDKGNEHPMA